MTFRGHFSLELDPSGLSERGGLLGTRFAFILGVTQRVLQVFIELNAFGKVVEVEFQLTTILSKVSIFCMKFTVFFGLPLGVLSFNIQQP